MMNLTHYKKILSRAKEKGYRFLKVSEAPTLDSLPEERFILMRHDIDISIEAAVQIAEIEYDNDISTCYYVRLHAPFYNALDRRNLAGIKKIQDMGHEIGLHYEPQYWEYFDKDPLQGVISDAKTLEFLLGEKIKSISQHQPSLNMVYEELFSFYPCAYQKHLVENIPYFGDSGYRWREGDILEKIGLIDRFHVLIHPHSWVHDGLSYDKSLALHGKAQCGFLQNEMEEYIVLIREYLARRDVLDRERALKYKSISLGQGKKI